MRTLTFDEATFVSAGANTQEPLTTLGAAVGYLYGAYVGVNMGLFLGLLTFLGTGAEPAGLILGGFVWIATTVTCSIMGAVIFSSIGAVSGSLIDGPPGTKVTV